MSKTIISYTILGILCLALTTPGWTQEKIWVSSPNAKLKDEKKSSAKTIAVLPIGTELTVNAFEKRWYNVTTPENQKGWIYRGKISKQKPAPQKEDEGADDLLADITASNIEAGASDTSRSMRGLSAEAKAYADNTQTPQVYRKALDQTLAFQIKPSEIETFLKQGKIGEYADE